MAATDPQARLRELANRLEEAEDTLRAIRSGEVDALVVDGPAGKRIYTLQSADHPYRAMIEVMQQGAASLSVDGTILYCNRSFAQMLGIPQERVIGSSVTGFVPPSSRPSLQAMLHDGSAGGSQGEIPLNASDGTARPVHVALNPLSLHEAPVLCMIVTDLTEHKKHQDLQDADRRKDIFLATLSHEMRTPLNAIVGWISILRREGCSAEDLREGLEVIDRNTRAQAQLIDDVLDVSRIITGKLRLDIRPCDLSEIVRSEIQVMRPLAEAKGVIVESQVDPSVCGVHCDQVRVQQIVSNLLSNAVKFTPRGGSIRVSLSRDERSIIIEVSDTGAGISPEFLNYVFDRFRQEDSTTRRKFGGLGLGLSIVKQLVELHGGTVEARSRGEGHGATFIVTLPIPPQRPAPEPDAAPAHQPETAPGSPPVRLDGVRIVIVDDEPDARRLLALLLRGAGATVTAAGTVAEARKAVAQLDPNVLISDIAMPDEDGHDLIRQLHADGHRVPAVALTAFAGKGYAQTALLAGFQVHVPKPINPPELLAVVRNLANEPRAQRT